MAPELLAKLSKRAALETSLDSLRFWLDLWTAVVVLGLVIEYGPEILEMWRKVVVRHSLKRLFTLIGGALITGGVAGELYVGITASGAEAKLRIVNGSIETDLRESASKNELELLKFKAPRILTPIQRERIRVKLQPFPGTPYELAVIPMPEAMSLVGTVDAILRSSAWANKESAKTNFRNVFTSAGGSTIEEEYLSGFVVKATKALLEKYQPAVDTLVAALRAEGIDARAEVLKDDDPSPASIHVAVGIKE
jgi:hypothetical protein